MSSFFSKSKLNLEKRINRLILFLSLNGIVLLLLAVLVVWSPLLTRLLIGFTIIVIAYIFLYLAYRVWEVKKHFEKYLKN